MAFTPIKFNKQHFDRLKAQIDHEARTTPRVIQTLHSGADLYPSQRDALEKLSSFALRLLSPEDLGYTVNELVRDAAREALGIPRVIQNLNQNPDQAAKEDPHG